MTDGQVTDEYPRARPRRAEADRIPPEAGGSPEPAAGAVTAARPR
jgi:hypothetical protein